ncbi:MAG: sigma-70 family RNA polymerase sigma factor [Bacteroidota bacterium]
MMEISDETLFEKLRNGDIKSLGIIYERYKDLLFNFFLRNTGNYHSSNDLVMETFERVFKYRHSFKNSKKIRPWIYQIASNLVKDYYKKSENNKSLDTLEFEDNIVHPEIPADVQYRHKLIQKALNRLKPSQRNIINMYYILEMSYQDIAVSENTSINSVRIKVCRALKKLNELLKDKEL